MSIWFKEVSVQAVNEAGRRTMIGAIGIEITEIGDDFVVGRMPVDERTRQIYGILHGGASVALAETLGSMGAHLTVDPDRFETVGLEINANHVRAVKDGFVEGRATPVHLGLTTQVWDIRITLPGTDKLVSVSRLTVAVRSKRHQPARS